MITDDMRPADAKPAFKQSMQVVQLAKLRPGHVRLLMGSRLHYA